MFDSGYNIDIYESAKIKIGAVMINPEILKFIPYHLKLKTCVSMQLKNYLIY